MEHDVDRATTLSPLVNATADSRHPETLCEQHDTRPLRVRSHSRPRIHGAVLFVHAVAPHQLRWSRTTHGLAQLHLFPLYQAEQQRDHVFQLMSAVSREFCSVQAGFAFDVPYLGTHGYCWSCLHRRPEAQATSRNRCLAYNMSMRIVCLVRARQTNGVYSREEIVSLSSVRKA